MNVWRNLPSRPRPCFITYKDDEERTFVANTKFDNVVQLTVFLSTGQSNSDDVTIRVPGLASQNVKVVYQIGGTTPGLVQNTLTPAIADRSEWVSLGLFLFFSFLFFSFSIFLKKMQECGGDSNCSHLPRCRRW